ncbi:uncharacterized protein LOC125536039 isoform X2 [Triticum urartu]|uniref:DUF1618 domain-containing protein n=1 Tax=Triticum urartu TaxID=4572 RepID=A0A8R7PBN7_TRIUA|nr:uncharacterized protein LOC125536037 isoform X2 [Triticum urartu]XP_048555081.1 uncharacterized protein LOC125536039 isoform X2 [Triticum urartu]
MGDAADAPRRRRLDSILLARKPRLTDSRNETTATAVSMDGFTMAVSFWMADPPQLSIFSIYCCRPPHLQAGPYCNFKDLPRVVGVGAEGRFVLFRAVFDRRYTSEYFLYKAGESPSLEWIPSPYEYHDGDLHDLRGVREFGVLQQLGGHYLVAALCLDPLSDDYHLRIYSSERTSWSTRTLPNPCPGVDRIIPDKVITLGEEGLLGWVDLSHGLLMCDLRQDHVRFTFIPLPEPLPGNRYKLKGHIPPPTAKRSKKAEDESHPNLWWFRDLAWVDGVLKFIEMENLAPESQSDKGDVIYDSDLIMSLERKAVDWHCKQLSIGGAWRAVTWTRTVSSNCWRQTCAANVADILVVDGSAHSSLLPGLKGEKLTFRDLYSAFPILSPDGDDILYLKSMVEPSNKDGWAVAVDLGNKAVKAIGKYCLPDDFYYSFRHDPEHPFRVCTLSRHLDMTPGIEVSACRKITGDASSSSNYPSNTSFRAGELNSCEPRSKIQRSLEWARKNKRARNAAGTFMQNDHISQLDDKVLELEQEIEQELERGWKQKREQKPQQQCFNKWDAPCYPPGHSVWPHQNNLSPRKYFNKPDGPCVLGYASLPPVQLGRHNYQPLWRSHHHQNSS